MYRLRYELPVARVGPEQRRMLVCDWNEHANNYKHNSKKEEILMNGRLSLRVVVGENGEDRWRVYWQCKSTMPLIDFEL